MWQPHPPPRTTPRSLPRARVRHARRDEVNIACDPARGAPAALVTQTASPRQGPWPIHSMALHTTHDGSPARRIINQPLGLGQHNAARAQHPDTYVHTSHREIQEPAYAIQHLSLRPRDYARCLRLPPGHMQAPPCNDVSADRRSKDATYSAHAEYPHTSSRASRALP
jgi:hypothetical protein